MRVFRAVAAAAILAVLIVYLWPLDAPEQGHQPSRAPRVEHVSEPEQREAAPTVASIKTARFVGHDPRGADEPKAEIRRGIRGRVTSSRVVHDNKPGVRPRSCKVKVYTVSDLGRATYYERCELPNGDPAMNRLGEFEVELNPGRYRIQITHHPGDVRIPHLVEHWYALFQVNESDEQPWDIGHQGFSANFIDGQVTDEGNQPALDAHGRPPTVTFSDVVPTSTRPTPGSPPLPAAAGVETVQRCNPEGRFAISVATIGPLRPGKVRAWTSPDLRAVQHAVRLGDTVSLVLRAIRRQDRPSARLHLTLGARPGDKMLIYGGSGVMDSMQFKAERETAEGTFEYRATMDAGDYTVLLQRLALAPNEDLVSQHQIRLLKDARHRIEPSWGPALAIECDKRFSWVMNPGKGNEVSLAQSGLHEGRQLLRGLPPRELVMRVGESYKQVPPNSGAYYDMR